MSSEPVTPTLRGEALAVVQPPGIPAGRDRESIADSLERLHPLLLLEHEGF